MLKQPKYQKRETEVYKSDNTEEVLEASWIKHYWRPAMAYQYLLVCLFDFIIFPMVTMAFYASTDQVYVQWQPITLNASGFYHLAMGAIIGVSAWTRGQEKITNIWKERQDNGETYHEN